MEYLYTYTMWESGHNRDNLQRHTVFYPVWQLTESPQTELRD